MYCWICRGVLSDTYHLLPERDDNIQITACKDFEIIVVDKFKFVYHTVCPYCLDMYLNNYPVDFRKLMSREIGRK